jgi:hypothetical protein
LWEFYDIQKAVDLASYGHVTTPANPTPPAQGIRHMNPHAFELVLNTVALSSMVVLVGPKILFHISLRRINKSTVGHLGATAYKPKTMVSPQSFDRAVKSVKKALAKKKRAFGWIVREHQARRAKTQAIQIEGYLPAARIAELNQSTDTKFGPAVDIKIRVDIYERAEGTEIVWKYLPNNATEAHKRQELLDPRFNSLLWETNSELLSELNPKLVQV